MLLFDEIEKAHQDVLNILLQVLDDGRVTDSQGRTVDFKNTVIIMTGNIGSQFLTDETFPDGVIPERTQKLMMDDLRHQFRPEFLNRVDDIVLFRSLTIQEIEKIVGLMLQDLQLRLKDRHIELMTTPDARALIAARGYDPVYGARPLKRFIQRELETRIGRALLAGDIRDGATILIDVIDQDLDVSIEYRKTISA